MSKNPEEKEPAFKVIDRRRFDEEGQDKGVEKESEEPKSLAPETKEAKKSLASDARVRPPMSFSLFVQSLGHQAMMGLGLVPWPDSGLVRKELELAKETIDVLKIIKEKSAGNLGQDEQMLIDTLVYQLQVAYVEIGKEAPLGDLDPIVK